MIKHLLFFISICLPYSSIAQGFVDVAKEHQLDFSYQTKEYGGGVSFVDFNQDGLDDLTFATNKGRPVEFFLNNGNGFDSVDDLIEDTSEVKQLLWVDYNNDQLLDLFLTSEGKNKLFKNKGNLELEDVTSEAGFNFPTLTSYCANWFDYDNDGKLDLVVAHRTIDHTGWIDLYRNLDYHTFEKSTLKAGLNSKGESVLAMTTFDYNNDGWQDIFLGQDWEKGNRLLKNNGNGTFKDVSRESGIDFKMNSMTATIMDINEDGWQDLYVSNTTMGNILLVNNQQGGFEEKASYYNLDLSNVTFGTVFFDADNDGDNDVHIGGMQVNHTFEDINNEEPFKKRNLEWGFFSDNEFNNGVATGDFNNDGFLDLVKNSVTRGDFFVSKNSLWENQFTENNYLKIELQGTISNRFAIGAKILVYTNDKEQSKRIGCGESFSSQHSLIQHFGIGKNDLVDSIVVQWPSRNFSVLTFISPNQHIKITEPPYGCTDPQACNFHPLAQSENGSCRYPDIEYNCSGCLEDADEDGICDPLEIEGCTEYTACNFSYEATENDGTCYYLSTHSISGMATQEAFKETNYAYPAQPESIYEWSIENGSILSGNETSEIIVIWYEKEKGHLAVKETNKLGCTGEEVSKEINITPLKNQLPLPIWINPNPVNDQIFVHNLNTEIHTYTIFNSMGQLVKKGIIDDIQNNIPMEQVSSGLYFLEISGDLGSFKSKIFKN